jgi:TPP-dependent pyruvate/acetoin dehydrogenase alpha subunit
MEECSQAFENIPTPVLVDILRRMIRIRAFEERLVTLFKANEIVCPIHLYVGQEAIAAGVCAILTREDYAFSTHRSHGHYIAKGGSLRHLMAEILCREDGCSHGRGGSMHITDVSQGFIASAAIVAGTIPLAVGAALKSKMMGETRVSVAFFGDGATDEGVFYECVNFAALNKLPVLFACENNLFSTHMPVFKRQSNQALFEKMAAFGLPSRRVDGNDVSEVYDAASRMIREARDGAGPSFLECMTYRWYSHVGAWQDLDVGFRKKEDVERWMARDPIEATRRYVATRRPEAWDEIARIDAGVVEEVVDAESFARSSSQPLISTIAHGLFAEKGA